MAVLFLARFIDCSVKTAVNPCIVVQILLAKKTNDEYFKLLPHCLGMHNIAVFPDRYTMVR